jgi:hypothetical protein
MKCLHSGNPRNNGMMELWKNGIMGKTETEGKLE